MHLTFALPALAGTGGSTGRSYAYGLAAALRSLGHQVDVAEGDAPSFAPTTIPIVDGLLLPHLLPRLPELVERGAAAVVHHVSARAGRDACAREAVQDIERTMLPALRRVVATSQPVADRLQQDFGVSDAAVVAPGLDALPRSTPGDGPVQILAAGVLTPRKGHDTLLQGLARLSDLDWRLTVAGSAERDPVHAAQLAAMVLEPGLAGRATVLTDPDPDAMERLWQSAGVFALATRWEGYPSGVAEALRRGVPVVVTAGGAVGGLVTPEAGIVCAPDDMPLLSKCLRRILFSPALRNDMAEGAWRAGQALPGWDMQARLFLAALQES